MMTVAIVVCEGPKMSLYQDLKLKRRKVDSRCSSDGEAVVDTNTCSPDSGIAAVDDCKKTDFRCEIQEPNTDRSSPDSVVQNTETPEAPHSTLSNCINQEAVSTQNNEEAASHATEEVDRSSPKTMVECNSSSCPEEEIARVSTSQRKPHATLDIIPKKPNNTDVSSIVVCGHQEDIVQSSSVPTSRVSSSPLGPTVGEVESKKNNDCSPADEVERPEYHCSPNSSASKRREILSSPKETRDTVITPVSASSDKCVRVVTSGGPTITSPSPTNRGGIFEHVLIHGGQSRVGVFDGGGLRTVLKTEPPDVFESVLEPTPSTSVAHMVSGSDGNCTQDMKISPIASLNNPQKSPPEKWKSVASPAVGAASTLLTSEVPGNVGPLWQMQSYRINGLRPELISGALVTAQNKIAVTQESKANYNSTCRLRTPSVIMGESGGVRTMVWTPAQPETTLRDKTHMYQETDTAVQASVDGLLSLGQERRLMQPVVSEECNLSRSTPSQVNSANSSIRVSRSLYQTPVIQDPSSPSSSYSNSRPPSTSLPPSPHRLTPASHISAPSRMSPYESAVSSTHPRPPLNMEALWATYPTSPTTSQPQPQPDSQALNLCTNWGAKHPVEVPPSANMMRNQDDDDEQPMICMICEDRATGLHYGIITCEGCKGFFKRTVQNKRVYTCVSDGNCEVNKPQRNRCQYCRFQKCLRQGMVIAAVREDRMPGGRNSGAVYNLYKVKYKKHKKNQKNGQMKNMEKLTAKQQPQQLSGMCGGISNGQILKMALTNPAEISHLRHRLEGPVTSSNREMSPHFMMQFDQVQSMIKALIDCDDFDDIATLQNISKEHFQKQDTSETLRRIGDTIVIKLVNWTKKLPFYKEISLEVVTALLTHKWHELVILTTSAYQAIHSDYRWGSTSTAGKEADFPQEMSNNLTTLQTSLMQLMGQQIPMDQLRGEVGKLIEGITKVTMKFRKLKLTPEEYVCLKVIIMLSQVCNGQPVLESIQQRYCMCLKMFVEYMYPNQQDRYDSLISCLPEVQEVGGMLLGSKRFYIPFFLNSVIHR